MYYSVLTSIEKTSRSKENLIFSSETEKQINRYSATVSTTLYIHVHHKKGCVGHKLVIQMITS